MYKALKGPKKLIAYEQELLDNAKHGMRAYRISGNGDRKSA